MDAAVVGIPHKVLGEEVGAVVQVKPEMSVTADELRRFVAQKIAAFKVPVEVIVQREPLPRNANGKIMKNELRAAVRAAGWLKRDHHGQREGHDHQAGADART